MFNIYKYATTINKYKNGTKIHALKSPGLFDEVSLGNIAMLFDRYLYSKDLCTDAKPSYGEGVSVYVSEKCPNWLAFCLISFLNSNFHIKSSSAMKTCIF